MADQSSGAIAGRGREPGPVEERAVGVGEGRGGPPVGGDGDRLPRGRRPARGRRRCGAARRRPPPHATSPTGRPPPDSRLRRHGAAQPAPRRSRSTHERRRRSGGGHRPVSREVDAGGVAGLGDLRRDGDARRPPVRGHRRRHRPGAVGQTGRPPARGACHPARRRWRPSAGDAARRHGAGPRCRSRPGRSGALRLAGASGEPGCVGGDRIDELRDELQRRGRGRRSLRGSHPAPIVSSIWRRPIC